MTLQYTNNVPKFWDYVIRTEGCWDWSGSIDENGYGTFGTNKCLAHRLMWEELNGVIEDGLQVCHKCDNRCCVNPEHLFLGTSKENMQDKVSKGRANMPHGEKSWKSLLSEEDVRHIIVLCSKSSLYEREIAEQFGVSRSCISQISQGKNWKHINRNVLPTIEEALSYMENRTVDVRRYNRVVDRFSSKILPKGSCWIWDGVISNGYGVFHFNSKSTKPHRFIWEYIHGPIPIGMLVCHKCDTKLCVNPSHLFIGTQLDNMKDMMRKGRQARGELNGRAKLSVEKVRFIRGMSSFGRTSYSIAQEVEMSPKTISDILNGKLWKHV